MKLINGIEYYNMTEVANILCIDRSKLKWFLGGEPVKPEMIGFRHWDIKGVKEIEKLYWFKKRGVRK